MARYDRKGEYDKAIQNFSAAIRLDGKNADFYHNRGFSYGREASMHGAVRIDVLRR